MTEYCFNVAADDADDLKSMCDEKGWKASLGVSGDGHPQITVYGPDAAAFVQDMLDVFADITKVASVFQKTSPVVKRKTKSFPQKSGYVLHKAKRFVRQGPELYRSKDFFKLPDASLSGEELETICDGMAQLADGHGWDITDSLQGIGISGVYNLIHTLHFEVVDRESHWSEDGSSVVDEMICRHVVDHRPIRLFNRVSVAEDE